MADAAPKTEEQAPRPTPGLALLLCAGLVLAACGGQDNQPAARFASGSRVLLHASTESLILYTTCGSPFGHLAGVANEGDDAVILERQWCNEDWWYRLQVGAMKREDWKGIGWLPEANLKPK